MVVCSVIGCGMRKSRNQASLTMHRFPTNASKKKMWLDAIGIENIKTNIKCMHICSLHFHEECFNKTLNVIRLRDDAVPSKFVRVPLKVVNTSTHTDSHAVSDSSGIATCTGEGGAGRLHERYVDYVRALSAGDETRVGVWGEHSYARARGHADRGAAHVKVLLGRVAPGEEEPVDVERTEARPAPPPDDAGPEPEPEPADDDPWEEAVRALAPSGAHARLADAALDALTRLRLARLTGAGAGATRAAARRLRLALAAPGGAPAAAWLHATLLARLPRGARALYDATLEQLRRSAPAAAARLTGAPPSRPAEAPPCAVDASAPGPWLVWAGACRWERHVRALVHSRVLRVPRPPCSAPEAWCSAAAGALSHALSEVLAEAGPERAVVLCGAGGDAALCCAVAGALPPPGAGVSSSPASGRLRGLLLLAPPLLTAEGARDSPDDPLSELRLPMLMVTGGHAASSWSGAARELCVGGGGGGGPRRLLELRGADDALRLPGAARARLRLPADALDAAVAEECARWACDVAAAPDHAPLHDVEMESDEFAHLVAAPSASSSSAVTSIEISESRVVSRGTGATPMALAPPRRSAPAAGAPLAPGAPLPPAAPRLAPADILQLPIVFADDEPSPDGDASGAALTVTSGDSRAGARRFTRVIVAKRGAGAVGGPAVGGPTVGGPAAVGGRALLLRRPLRLAHPQ